MPLAEVVLGPITFRTSEAAGSRASPRACREAPPLYQLKDITGFVRVRKAFNETCEITGSVSYLRVGNRHVSRLDSPRADRYAHRL